MDQEEKLVYKQGEDGNMEWITYYPNSCTQELHLMKVKIGLWKYDCNWKLIYHKNGNSKKFTYR